MNRRHWVSRKIGIFVFIVAGFSSSAWAACFNDSGAAAEVYFQLGTVGWPRDAVVGKTFYTQEFPVGSAGFPNIQWHCDGAPGPDTYASVRAGSPVPGMPNVYATGIPGIGAKFSRRIVGGSGWVYFTYSYFNSSGPNSFNGWIMRVELVKTADAVSAGTSNLIHIADYVAAGAKLYDWYLLPFQINSPTCTVTTPSVTATLPDVSMFNFPSIGATYGNVNFNINLQCSRGTSLYMTLTDNTAPGNYSDVLSLTTDSEASGIGFQIRRGGTLVSYGADSSVRGNPNQFYLGESTDGTFSIPLSARYIRTDRIITPGIAKGRATFTMSYQ